MKMTKRRRMAAFSAAFALLVTVTGYSISNSSYPLAGEVGIQLKLDKAKALLNINHDSVPDDVMLVNVCYDKQLVPYEQHGLPVGNIVATDRSKLLRLLQAARRSGGYKYIVLDVNFEKGIDTPCDSALFATIVSMPRIVIPEHADVVLADERLRRKAANADYNTTWKATIFSRYQFLHDNDRESVPMRLYHDLAGGDIKRWGPLYFSQGHLCRNALTLRLPIKISGEFNAEKGMETKNFLYLGTDLVDIDSIVPIAEQIRDKIVVVGDFQNDVHSTYAGKQPGSLLCMNAYYALQRGDHIVSITFELFMLVIYALLAYVSISGFSLRERMSHPWLKLFASFIGITFVLTAISVVMYLFANVMFNAVIPSIFFAGLGLVTNIANTLKTKQ